MKSNEVAHKLRADDLEEVEGPADSPREDSPPLVCSVEPSDDGFAVLGAAGRIAVFSDRRRACLVAAISPQADRGLEFRLVRRAGEGFDVTLGSSETVGWMREYSPETIEALHILEGIVTSPTSRVWLLEAILQGHLVTMAEPGDRAAPGKKAP